MAWVQAFGSNSVYITRYCSMKVPVSFRTLHAMANKNILVDLGATNNFIHTKLLKWLGLGAQALEWPQKIWNINRTTNWGGHLTHFVNLEVQMGKEEQNMCFLVTDLGNEDLILGYPWLSTFEPSFSWREGVINTTFLPIFIWSLDWRKTHFKPTIARIVAGWCICTPPSLEWLMLERKKSSHHSTIRRQIHQSEGNLNWPHYWSKTIYLLRLGESSCSTWARSVAARNAKSRFWSDRVCAMRRSLRTRRSDVLY